MRSHHNAKPSRQPSRCHTINYGGGGLPSARHKTPPFCRQKKHGKIPALTLSEVAAGTRSAGKSAALSERLLFASLLLSFPSRYMRLAAGLRGGMLHTHVERGFSNRETPTLATLVLLARFVRRESKSSRKIPAVKSSGVLSEVCSDGRGSLQSTLVWRP